MMVHRSSIWKCLILWPPYAIDASKIQQAPRTCSGVVLLWTISVQTFSLRWLVRALPPNASAALVGAWPSPPSLSPKKGNLIVFVCLLARRLILLNWKSPKPPTHTDRVTEVFYFIKLEMNGLSQTGEASTFNEIWKPFLFYLHSRNCKITVEWVSLQTQQLTILIVFLPFLFWGLVFRLFCFFVFFSVFRTNSNGRGYILWQLHPGNMVGICAKDGDGYVTDCLFITLMSSGFLEFLKKFNRQN